LSCFCRGLSSCLAFPLSGRTWKPFFFHNSLAMQYAYYKAQRTRTSRTRILIRPSCLLSYKLPVEY
jgi:hypothetical protein